VPYLEYEHGNAVAYFKELKKVFDPKGIMNPGKKFKWEGKGTCGEGAPAPGHDGGATGGGNR
jgi:hypothetical protein